MNRDRTCSVAGLVDGLDVIATAAIDVTAAHRLATRLLDTSTPIGYTFGRSRPSLDGVRLDDATLVDLAAELNVRAALAEAAIDHASAEDVLTFLADPVAATAYLVAIMRPGETFGAARERALAAGHGDLDAGVWHLRSQVTR